LLILATAGSIFSGSSTLGGFLGWKKGSFSRDSATLWNFFFSKPVFFSLVPKIFSLIFVLSTFFLRILPVYTQKLTL